MNCVGGRRTMNHLFFESYYFEKNRRNPSKKWSTSPRSGRRWGSSFSRIGEIRWVRQRNWLSFFLRRLSFVAGLRKREKEVNPWALPLSLTSPPTSPFSCLNPKHSEIWPRPGTGSPFCTPFRIVSLCPRESYRALARLSFPLVRLHHSAVLKAMKYLIRDSGVRRSNWSDCCNLKIKGCHLD